MAALQNRPFKYGPKDRVEFIVYNSEMKIVAENDSDGNTIYIGRAKLGSLIDEPVWQISKYIYDSNGSFLQNLWPVNIENAPSSEYEFIWEERATYNYQ